MNWDSLILDHYKKGLTTEEIAEITPFDIESIASSIHFEVENGRL